VYLYTDRTRTVNCRLGLYTARSRPRNGRVHEYTCTRTVFTAITRPCTVRVHGRKRPCTRPTTWPIHNRVHGPCTRPVHGPCTCSCTRAVYTSAYTACRVYGTYTTVHTDRHDLYMTRTSPVHGRLRPPNGRVLAVYTADRKWPRTRPVVYIARTRPYTAHTQPCTARTRPCTRPYPALTRPGNSHVRGRVRCPARTLPCTRAVHAVYIAV